MRFISLCRKDASMGTDAPFRAAWNQDADSIQASVEIDGHAVLIKPLGVVPSRRKMGRSTTPIIAEA
jgi:hypothetical protein